MPSHGRVTKGEWQPGSDLLPPRAQRWLGRGRETAAVGSEAVSVLCTQDPFRVPTVARLSVRKEMMTM